MSTATHVGEGDVMVILVRHRAFVKGDARGHKADFSFTDISGISLTKEKLEGVSFKGANIAKGSLKNCDLTGADFFGADMEGADLSGSNLAGADFAELIYTGPHFPIPTFAVRTFGYLVLSTGRQVGMPVSPKRRSITPSSVRRTSQIATCPARTW